MSNTTVLIPHYNNLSSLQKTLKSIYHSKKIDVLVIDDGSEINKIPELPKLNSFLNPNVYLSVLNIGENKGIAYALNYGLDYILKEKKNQFIARIDCGDVCVSNRFEIQEQFLIENKEVDVVGSWVRWIDSKGEQVFCKKPPEKHKKIKRKMSVRCTLIHPSTMYRTTIVDSVGKYPDNYEAAEDYAYFFDIANHSQTANIPKFLTNVEHNEQGISNSKRKEQSKSKLKVIVNYSPLNLHLLYGLVYNIFLMSIGPATILKFKTKIFSH